VSARRKWRNSAAHFAGVLSDTKQMAIALANKLSLHPNVPRVSSGRSLTADDAGHPYCHSRHSCGSREVLSDTKTKNELRWQIDCHVGGCREVRRALSSLDSSVEVWRSRRRKSVSTQRVELLKAEGFVRQEF